MGTARRCRQTYNTAYDIGMHVQLRGDGVHRPFFSEVQTPDLSGDVQWQSHGLLRQIGDGHASQDHNGRIELYHRSRHIGWCLAEVVRQGQSCMLEFLDASGDDRLGRRRWRDCSTATRSGGGGTHIRHTCLT